MLSDSIEFINAVQINLSISIYQLPKPEDLCHLWIAVDDRFVLNLARSVSISQSAERLLGVRVGRADACNHQSVTVASERVYTQTDAHNTLATTTVKPRAAW